jgi:dual specificity phosphatase 12
MTERKMRVAIVGAQRARVAKVISLMTEEDTHIDIPNSEEKICVEYLPCVAMFDSYENEQQQQVRYLAKVEYHGADGKQRGSSLAPFFDDDEEIDGVDESNVPSFPGISAVAMGCGIESQQDVDMIQTLVKSLAGLNDGKETRSVLVQCVTPNPEYPTMKEENEAFKTLDAEEKEEVTRLRDMGPGKMAKFASTLAKAVVDVALNKGKEKDTADTETVNVINNDAVPSIPNIIGTNQPNENPLQPLEIDPNKTRYACRKCRTILFGQDQLEDPPHVPMMHSFSRKSSYGTSSQCESLFLSNGLDWMGDISAAVEGKFSCPKCCTKIGHWKWAGAQCSCGTWVTPAIQVPNSKVDNVAPYNNETNPPAAVILGPTIACGISSLKS